MDSRTHLRSGASVTWSLDLWPVASGHRCLAVLQYRTHPVVIAGVIT